MVAVGRERGGWQWEQQWVMVMEGGFIIIIISRSITTATTITTLTTTCLPSSVFPIQEKVGWWGNMTSMDGGESISQQNQLTGEWQEYTTIELLE